MVPVQGLGVSTRWEEEVKRRPMNLTDAEIVALFVAATAGDIHCGPDLQALRRAAQKLGAEIEDRKLPLARKNEHGSADRFAAKRLGRRVESDRAVWKRYAKKEGLEK